MGRPGRVCGDMDLLDAWPTPPLVLEVRPGKRVLPKTLGLLLISNIVLVFCCIIWKKRVFFMSLRVKLCIY